MALNFGGLGVLFGGKDVGLGKVISSIAGGMQSLGNAVGDEFTRNSRRLSGSSGLVAASIHFMGMAATKTTGSIEQLGDRLVSVFKTSHVEAAAFLDNFNTILNDTQNLTTGLEGQMVGLSKGARQLGANFGYTGAALDKFTKDAAGMALALNVGEQTTAKAIRGYEEMSQALDVTRALGLKSAKDLAKFTEAFGVDADTLRNSALQMRMEFGLSEDAISNVVGSIVSMGQASGDVAAAVNEIPQVMEMMRKKAALMGQDLSDLDKRTLAGVATQTSAVAAGLFRLGQSSDQVRSAAMEITGSFLEAQKGFQDMFAGVSEGLPEMISEFAIVGGDVNKAMQLMQSGPAGFMQGMAEMVQNAKKTEGGVEKAFDFMRARLGKIFPGASEQLMNFFRNADDAALKAMATTQVATAELGKLGKETFRTGRTMAEQMELMQESFINRLRKGAKGEVKDFVKGTRKEFSVWADKLNELSKDDGPMGLLARKMALVHHVGAKGLLPKALQPMAQVFGTLASQLGPLLVGFKLLGGSFTSLLGPVGLVIGALGVLGFAAFDTWKKTKPSRKEGKQTEEFLDRFRTKLLSMSTAFVDWIKAIDWNTVSAAFNTVIDEVGKVFSAIPWEELGNTVWEGLTRLFNLVPWEQLGMTVWEGIVKLYEAIPWEALTQKFVDTSKTIWDRILAVWGEFKTVDLMQKFGSLSGIEKGIIGIVTALVAFKAGVIAANVVMGIWKGLMIASKVALVAWQGILITAKVAMLAWNGVMLAGKALVTVFNGVMTLFNAIMAANPVVLITLAIIGLIAGLALLIANWDEFREAWLEGISIIVENIKAAWQVVSSALLQVWEGIKSAISTGFEWIKSFIEGYINFLLNPFEGMKTVLTTIFGEDIPAPIISFLDWISGKWEELKSLLTGPFEGLWDKVKGWFGNSMNTIIGDDMAASVEKVQAGTDEIAAYLTKVLFESVTTAMIRAFSLVFEKVQSGTDQFAENMITKLQMLAGSIEQTFLDMWTKIVAEGIAALEMMDSIVAQLTGSFERLATTRAMLTSASKETTKPADVAALRAEVRKTTTLEEAIHDPAWYTDPLHGYEFVFKTEMHRLIAAVNALKTSGPGAAITAPENIRGALARAGTAAIGGAGTRALGR